MTTTAACVRGCGLRRRHLTGCDNPDHCPGCLPRRADHGLLCWPCHRRFELMLHDAPTVDRWLTGHLAADTGTARVRQDFERGAPDDLPAAVNDAVLDVRDLLRDRLALWVDDLCENVHLTGPGRHSVAADAKFLRVWLGTVERLEWVGDWWDELAETMRDAHALAPWRPEARRVSGVPCPECGETSLVIFGGESDATCTGCHLMIPERHMGVWERIVRDEQGVG